MKKMHRILGAAAMASVAMVMFAQPPAPSEPDAKTITPRPDPKEIPLPVIKTDMKPMPGVWDPLESTCRHASLSIL